MTERFFSGVPHPHLLGVCHPGIDLKLSPPRAALMNSDEGPSFFPGKPRTRGIARTLLLVALLVLETSLAQADWPQFRGPRGDGWASAPGDTKPLGLPLYWSETNNVKWKTEIPYRGWSTPVVMDGQVWLTTATVEGHDFFAICVDARTGKIRNLTSYGAFIELEEGLDGMIHVSDMSWTRKINHPSEVIKRGDEVEAVVLEVDKSNQRIAVGMKQLGTDPWEGIDQLYKVGDLVTGNVTKLASFGAFIGLQHESDGMVYISHIS